jgi:HK97 family phage portal protein
MDVMVGDAGTSGVTVNETTALSSVVVFACVRNLSEDIAKLPLLLYRRLKPRGKERASELPLYRVLKDAPNEEMTSMDFRQSMMVDVLLGGNGYAEIVRDGGGRALAMYKLDRCDVKPIRIAGGGIMYKVRQPKQDDVFVPAADMLHIKGLGDGLVGWSVIKLAKESIGLGLAAESAGGAFFGNGSQPSGVLTAEKKISPEAAANLRDSWERLHGGPKNRGKIAVLEEGIKFNAMSISPEDAQFLETRQFQVEDVARWFRMPPHKIGNLARATGWSTLEATNTDYIVDTLMPWTERWEQEIQRKLIAPSDTELFAEHLFDALLRGDTAARSAFYREQWGIGAMSQNDIRESENRNPIGPEGDIYYVPLNMVPSEVAAKGPTLIPPKEPPAKKDPSTPDKTPARTARERVSLLAEAHRGVLEESYARVLRVEQDKVSRARKKADFSVWVDSFYKDHSLHVRSGIGTALEAFCSSAWAILSDEPCPDALTAAINAGINDAAGRHVSRSAGEYADVAKVEGWPTRAGEQAKEELSVMAKLLCQFAGVFNENQKSEVICGN